MFFLERKNQKTPANLGGGCLDIMRDSVADGGDILARAFSGMARAKQGGGGQQQDGGESDRGFTGHGLFLGRELNSA